MSEKFKMTYLFSKKDIKKMKEKAFKKGSQVRGGFCCNPIDIEIFGGKMTFSVKPPVDQTAQRALRTVS